MGFDSHYVISVCELRECQKANDRFFKIIDTYYSMDFT